MQGLLLDWFHAARRDLPWRQDRTPYRVWISEVMLQQTRVDVVVPYFVRWMDRFPDVQALAEATEEDVLATWSGLGYYRRARHLHAAAKQIVADGWPMDAAGWARLPGIGPYASAAIASMVHNEAVAAVDGNVQRVVSRLLDMRDRIDAAAGRRRLQAAADSLLECKRPGEWNEAMMELGATVCRPTPLCSECPVARHCASFAAGHAADLPVRSPKRPPRRVAMHFARIEADGRTALVRRPEGVLLAGTWCLPGGPREVPLTDMVAQQTGLVVDLAEPAGRVVHVFSHRIWDMHVHDAMVVEADHRQPDLQVRWARRTDMDQMGLSAAARRALDAEPFNRASLADA